MSLKKFLKSDKKALLEAIHTISNEVNAHDNKLADQSHWDWRYNELSTGKTHIYLVKENNLIVGYYHIPTYNILVGNKKMIIGNIQSVAVSKLHRNKNIFQKLAKFTNQDINKYVDLIYTFPNHKSIHTFIKYNNFEIVANLPLFLRPIAVKKFFQKKLKIRFLGFII
mgnify:CR=1 FL=1